MRPLLVSVLLLAGCNSDSSVIPSAEVPQAASLTVRYPSARVGDTRYTLTDEQGHLLVPPVIAGPSAVHTLTSLPTTPATLHIEGPDEEFDTQVDLSEGSVTVENPELVASESKDPTVSSFVTFGCNRVQKADETPSIPSTANVAQLTQDFQEILAFSPRPAQLFFTGDLVLNAKPGSAVLSQQLTAWKSLYASSVMGSSSVELVAMTGNHEVLTELDDGTEIPNPATLPVWTSLMAPYIRGNNGPTTAAPNADGLTADQSQLSYTFRTGDTAWVVLNTDTFIDDTTLGDIPLNWLTGQLQTLNADSTVKDVFVFGHKPAVSPHGAEAGLLESQVKPFENLLNAQGSKVRAYLCAHAHLWEKSKLGSVPQVIAGNGGSKVEKAFEKHGYFGYTIVKRKQSGKYHVESYGRPIPSPYDSTKAQPASTRREKYSISG